MSCCEIYSAVLRCFRTLRLPGSVAAPPGVKPASSASDSSAVPHSHSQGVAPSPCFPNLAEFSYHFPQYFVSSSDSPARKFKEAGNFQPSTTVRDFPFLRTHFTLFLGLAPTRFPRYFSPSHGLLSDPALLSRLSLQSSPDAKFKVFLLQFFFYLLFTASSRRIFPRRAAARRRSFPPPFSMKALTRPPQGFLSRELCFARSLSP